MSVVSDVMSGAQSVPVEETASASKKSRFYGKTVGEPQLSEKAAKYYEQLKSKYSNMDFILVSADQKEAAKAKAASYANGNSMVVLIDEEKIERMAEDKAYREQYEGIIRNAASGLSQMIEKIKASGASVKGVGMQVNGDGTASFFAVMDKSFADQRTRMEKRAAAKQQEKKAAASKAKKEEAKERLEKLRDNKRTEKEDDSDTITASSMEELMQKIDDYMQMTRTDYVQTETEKSMGQNIDFFL